MIHESHLHTLWPRLARSLLDHKITLHLDESSSTSLEQAGVATSDQDKQLIHPAQPDSYDLEYLDAEMAVKIVPSVADAVTHINAHSSHHTESILTSSDTHAAYFVRGVSSADVFINASTRFADGQRFGLGTEVGISTGKTHARGPVGLEGLCIYKWILKSTQKNGSTVGDFGPGKKTFTHSDLSKEAPF